MRIKLGPIIVFFIIYLFVWNLANAEEPKLNCETFVKENICNMTDEEAEKWFWEFFKRIMEPKETEVEIVEV
jgi:hypothetical protein